MANNANSSSRGVHVSPGVYSREVEIPYAVRSLGITTLGLVGETLRGPAFEPINIESWRDFQNIFGGTSTEKFKGSQYPKYELPYIAKSYLTESRQLNVVRVLGLSGYDAGPAWLVTAEDENGNGKTVVAVIRSRGSYLPYDSTIKGTTDTGDCICQNASYDVLRYAVGEIKAESEKDCYRHYNLNALAITAYTSMDDSSSECGTSSIGSGDTNGRTLSATNNGRFKIIGLTGRHDSGESIVASATGYFEYAVSLNPSEKDYILKVLGTTNDDGDAPIYVESLYDVALQQGIIDGSLVRISSALTPYQSYRTADFCQFEPVYDLLTEEESSLTRKYVGRRYLATGSEATSGITCHAYDYTTGKPINASGSGKTVSAGQIYTVSQYTDADGKRNYFYSYYDPDTVSAATLTEREKNIIKGKLIPFASATTSASRCCVLVKNNADGLYYKLSSGGNVVYVACDLNDYKSSYRYASTPWIVSNLKGDMTHIEVNKLFRFHTISDGDSANYEIKVSIENVKPDEGLFDVVIRDITDSDDNIIVLEKFSRCSMVPGTNNYIAYKIGSFDGVYEPKSKYVTVEVNDSTAVRNSVPAGFIGYPQPHYSSESIDGSTTGNALTFPRLKYNRYYDQEIKNRKQYFGISSWVGFDVDAVKFNGVKSYIENPELLTPGFHLDCRIDKDNYTGDAPVITVDGEDGYNFEAVSQQSRTTTLDGAPIIGTEEEMYGSIYENTNLRKFTVCFYGGFDGWDIFRTQRSNTDEFKLSNYKGFYSTKSGEGYAFNMITNPDGLGLNQKAFTSDWYAYLAGIRQFANPEAVDINIFATPGIDYVNQKALVEEAIEMIEEERADSIYIVTTPDKPSGAGDYVDEMYTPEDAVYNLEDSEINSNYTCTYYPWVKYLDATNNQYIYLPVTKDVVRNMALTDNTKYPWFAPAGLDRGDVECERAHFITRVGEEDTLYDGRINPVKTFASDGVKIWGQKNLQIEESQLNRIATRRLLLRMRKLIAVACLHLIFDPNDVTMKNSFISTVTPILDNIRENRGITDYRIEVDDSVEARQNRELPAKLYFKPTNALEYITLDFILTPEGVNFEDI